MLGLYIWSLCRFQEAYMKHFKINTPKTEFINFLPRSVLLCFPSGDPSSLVTSTHLIIWDRSLGTTLCSLSSSSLTFFRSWSQPAGISPWGWHFGRQWISAHSPLTTEWSGKEILSRELQFAARKTGLSTEAEAQGNDESCKQGSGLVAGQFETKIV